MDVDALYGAPLEQFVAQRGALARELRNEGKREAAAEVAALRKPSVAAWAVNQLVRTQPRSFAELFDAGDALQEAHRTATSGRGDGGALRAASQQERAAVEMLMEAARGLLTAQGHELSATIMDRVAETLRAAALDSDARAQVRDGRLERELRLVGLGVMTGAGALQAPTSGRPRDPGRREPSRREPSRREPSRREPSRREASPRGPRNEAKGAKAAEQESKRREQQAESERRKRERAQTLKAAREIESKARRRAERAARAVKLAQERRDRAADDLRSAEQSFASASAEADAAAAEHRRAQDELGRI
jgi:hypothetical protein